MPLPTENTVWPPPPYDELQPQLAAWSAWWVGDPDTLAEVYTGQNAPRVRPSQLAGGVIGKAARWFWGTPSADHQGRKHRLHVPVAADLATASADLLFSEPPAITHPNAGTQDRIGKLVDDGLHTALAEAAEVSAALSGVYLRVTWDKDMVPEGPFITSIHGDSALPEFRWGRLHAVTFHRVIEDADDGTVWRHLERHELNSSGIGVILNGLYLGTRDQLGTPRDLKVHTGTAHLEPEVSTETPGLAVEFIPNRRPARRLRRHPVGYDLGRPDLEGIEPEMDALDEVWTSWMRDIRLGKSRVFMAKSLLDTGVPGQGAQFDSDRELYSPVNLLAGREGGLKDHIHAEQFKIRVEEHRGTADDLLRIILRTAGYSAQTFGESAGEGSSRQVTATETRSRERRSYLTRDRKVRLWRPGTVRLTRKLLAVDRVMFRTPGVDDLDTPPEVDFPDGVQDDPKVLAETAQLLNNAEAASTQTLVQMVHPDWDDKKVGEEVERILNDRRQSNTLLSDPMLTGREAPDPPGTDPDDQGEGTEDE